MSLLFNDYCGNYLKSFETAAQTPDIYPFQQIPGLQTSASWGGRAQEEEAASPEFRTKTHAKGLLWISKASTFWLLFQDNSQEIGFSKFFYFGNYWEAGRTNRTGVKAAWVREVGNSWSLVLIGSWEECPTGQKIFCFLSLEQSLMMGVELEISREVLEDGGWGWEWNKQNFCPSKEGLGNHLVTGQFCLLFFF